MNTKILIIGQAPPAVKQQYPYDTTMLYEWFAECGVSKEDAQGIFIFQAMSDRFPGFDANGGHLKPSHEDISRHWVYTLEPLLHEVDKVILLGRVAADYFNNMPKTWSCDLQVLELIHPSKRNYALYNKNKAKVIEPLKKFLNP